MNCIFCCVFNFENLDMFYFLLESIFIYGDLDYNTCVLVYTSTRIMNSIKQSHLFNNEKIKFEINNTYELNSIEKSHTAKLDFFNLSSSINYEKILYLNTSMIIKDNINKLFEVCKENILYVVEEGNFADNKNDFWGQSLFGNEINNYKNKTPFTCEIILFNNCEKLKNLFVSISKDMIDRPYSFCCYDQPYIIYNAVKLNLYDNRILNKFFTNGDESINSNKVIHNFPGCPCVYKHKKIKMSNFLRELKDFTIGDNINKAKQYINLILLPIIRSCNEKLEGNIFMLHQTTEYTNVFLNKTKNISNLVLNKNIKHVMEIGFNSGFSTLLMLLSNPNIRVSCFDLGEHKYTIPCYNKLKETFGDRIELTIGDSTKTLKKTNECYELIHIDGGHSVEVANSDIINSYRLSKQGTILIMDDYDFPHLHKLWDNYIAKYNLKKLDIITYESPHHDLKYV